MAATRGTTTCMLSNYEELVKTLDNIAGVDAEKVIKKCTSDAKIKDDEEKIEELRTYGTPARSKSITRFSKSSTRMDPEEALEAIIKDKQACIESDQHEVDVLEEALEIIKPDPYYESVSGRYFEGLDNEAIAESLGCDATTVWRNRQRLIKSLSVRLYGTAAID